MTLHLTVAAVIETQGRFLLVEERANGALVFNQPAGHVEVGESIHAAVCREVWEETAWRFKPEALLGLYQFRASNGAAFYRICFCGQVFAHAPQQALDEGIYATHWLSRTEIVARHAALRTPMVLRCVDDYLSGIRYPLEMLVNFDLDSTTP
jgi:8-oxo-dGTP pyrophosphatase MutT (NUDIX family)